MQAVFHRVHGDGPAVHHQVVLREYAVAVVAVHGKLPLAVHGQVAGSVDAGVRVLAAVGGAVRQGVLRAGRQGDEALVGLVHADRRAIGAGYAGAGKHDLHLVVFAGVHHDAAVGQRSRHHIGSGLGDGDRLPVGRCARAVHACGAGGKRDGGGGIGFVGSVHVALGIVQVKRRGVEGGRHFLEACVLGALAGVGVGVRAAGERQQGSGGAAEQGQQGFPQHYRTSFCMGARPSEIFRLPFMVRISSIMRFSRPACFMWISYSSWYRLPMLVVLTSTSSWLAV